MFTEKITPRFSDTDALGHINNTMVPIWFEGARNPIFKLFQPDLSPENWPLILAKIDVEFHKQMYYQDDMQLKTYIGHLGNSSFTVYQEVWQKGQKCASGNAVMVHFDYSSQKSAKIPDPIKAELSKHIHIRE